MTAGTVTAPPECAGAAHSPRGGTLARAGRRRLREELTTPAPTTDELRCDCTRCAPAAPMSDIEAQRAVRHVPAAVAVAYATGQTQLVGCVDCEHCGAWMPTFIGADE